MSKHYWAVDRTIVGVGTTAEEAMAHVSRMLAEAGIETDDSYVEPSAVDLGPAEGK
jgi:hypothetical protein